MPGGRCPAGSGGFAPSRQRSWWCGRCRCSWRGSRSTGPSSATRPGGVAPRPPSPPGETRDQRRIRGREVVAVEVGGSHPGYLLALEGPGLALRRAAEEDEPHALVRVAPVDGVHMIQDSDLGAELLPDLP